MNPDQILDMIGDARGEYILQAQRHRAGTAKKPRPGLRRSLLIAAVIGLMLLLVGCTIAYTQGWFVSFFRENSGTLLTPEQIHYLEENEQVIGETNAKNGWTVELRSALSDGTTGYIIIGITAPEGTNLEPRIEDSRILDRFTPQNAGFSGRKEEMPRIITPPEGVRWSQLTMGMEEDGDGLDHTKNFVIQLYPDLTRSDTDPFGPEAVYHIYMENIVREYDDEAYRQHLLDTKYAGQDAIMFTQEEIDRMSKVDVLLQGIWEFDISFTGSTQQDSSQQAELLSQPMKLYATVTRSVEREGWLISDNVHTWEEVTLTSVILKPLSVTFYTEEENVSLAFDEQMNLLQVFAVMKDGSRIELLPYGTHGLNYQMLDAETPLILSEVDHILMGDGTVIPVPAQ